MICKCQYILCAMFQQSHHSGRFGRFCTIIGFSYCLIRCLSFPADVAPTCFCSWIIWMVPTFNSDWHVHLYIPYMFVACFWNYAAGINEIGCYLLHIPWFRAPQVTWSSLDKNWWNQKGGVSYHSTHGELLFSCWQLHHVGDTVDGSEIPNTHLGGMKPCD